MASLAEEIALLTNPAPVNHDPEDIDDVTRAKVASRSVDDVDDDLPQSSTKLRRQAASLLVDEDKRYAGRKVTRQKLKEQGGLSQLPTGDESDSSGSVEEHEVNLGNEDEMDDEEDEDNSEDEEGSEDEEDSEDEDEEDEDDDKSEKEYDIDVKNELADFKKLMKMKSNSAKTPKTEFSFENDGDYSKFADDSGDEESSDDEDDEDDEKNEGEEEDEEESEEEDEEEKDGISTFSKTKADEEVRKGESTKTQLTLWDQLLKARIELQKVVLLVNQLPQPDTWSDFYQAGGADYSTALAEGQAAVKSLLDKIFYLQLRLLLLHPDTKNIEETSNKKPGQPVKPALEEGDEEITSDSDVEQEEHTPTPKQNLKRKHPLTDYPQLLAKRHKAFTPYRNETIQKWFDKTRVSAGKINRGFSAFEQSALKQIRQILSDRDRLVKRTQLKRSSYRVLGKPEQRDDVIAKQDDIDVTDGPPQTQSRDRLKEYDEEIFDDDDFYHQLLRELIERKSLNTNDPIALSRQWLELQKLRSKVKRKVDTRASKGRKIRYDIIPKLVNFMAPIDNSAWTEEARDELYSSLFGKRNPELKVQ